MHHVAGDDQPRGEHPRMAFAAFAHPHGRFLYRQAVPCEQHEHSDVLIVEQARRRPGEDVHCAAIVEAQAGGQVPQLESGQGAQVQPRQPLRAAEALQAGADHDAGAAASLRREQRRQGIRKVLAVGIERDHARVAVAARVADAGLGRAPGPQADRQPQRQRAGGSGAGAGVIRAGVVYDEYVATQGRSNAGHDLGNAGAFVASGNDRQAMDRAG